MKTGKIILEKLNLSNYEEIIETKKGFFQYKNTSYFYKRCKSDLAYRELIAYEISNLLNIPSTFYQIIEIPAGRFEGTSGVIAKDYRTDNINFTKGYFVLKDYYNDYLKEWGHNDRENNKRYNNLENIWTSLEYRYKFLDNKNQIIEKLFNQIIYNMFLFDILTSNADRHFHNWEIVDNDKTDEIYLNKNYDNEDIFLRDYSIPELAISNSTNQYDWYDTLREFLIISDNLYLDMILEMLNKLTPEILIKIFTITEKRHSLEIPLSLKQEIIKKYNIHYEKIKLVVDEFTTKRNKKILHK